MPKNKKFTTNIYNILIDGGFISADSTDSLIRNLYQEVNTNFEEYVEYYDGIGLNLEQGEGYFFFSRNETKVEIEEKYKKFSRWIAYIDIFRLAFQSNFRVGFHFRKNQFVESFPLDMALEEKAKNLFEHLRAKNYEEIATKLIEKMERRHFIECTNRLEQSYKVVAAYGYLESLIDAIPELENTEYLI